MPPPPTKEESIGFEKTILGKLYCRIGLGLLRLTDEGRPDVQDAIALIHLAFDHGVRILDTADSYCLNDKELHYGEVLAARALQSWTGAKHEVKILTKVGFARPKGKWVPAASPKHLQHAVDGSLKTLDVERLFLVQLHARDPRVPFEETLAALAQLQRAGKIEHIGLCNVNAAELRQAERHFVIASVQNELNIFSRSAGSDGMLELTRRLQIPFLAYRPLGGTAKIEKLATNRGLAPLLKRYNRPASELALACLLAAGEHVVPLVGARRGATLLSSLSALQIQLDEADVQHLDAKLSFAPTPAALIEIEPRVLRTDLPQLAAGLGPNDAPEVVLLMGIQGAGKSNLVNSYVAAGYARLNRDDLGGKLDDLAPALREVLAGGAQRVVLDNTYPTRLSRAPIIHAAHAHGLPVRCRYLTTSPSEARFNVAQRILERYGRLLGPDDMKQLGKSDPNLPPPSAMQRFMESFEPPQLDEGFAVVDLIPFERRTPSQFTKKGLLLDVDGTLRTTKSGELYPRHCDDVELLPGRREVLERWLAGGYELFFVSNQSGISSDKLSSADADACFSRTVDLLGLPVSDIVCCPHPAFPVGCFCRKPLPGMAVQLMLKHHLSPRLWVVVGDLASDAAFAAGIGARYFDAKEFFDSAQSFPSRR